MKYNLTQIAVAVMCLSSCVVFAQSYTSYSYNRARKIISYEGKIVREADYATFRDLGYGYAKDRNHVYQYGVILEYVDPSSFRVDVRYGIDSDFSWEGLAMGGVHRPDRGGYYVSTFDVLYNGEKVPEAVAGSFEILKEEYGKDAFSVFWRGKEIEGAVSSSFVCLGHGYAKDAFHVYWRGRKVEGALSSSFKVTDGYYAEDAFNTYFKGKKVQ